MNIDQHITDPGVYLRSQEFTEPLVVNRTGTSYGRFLFTEHAAVMITDCVFRVGRASIAVTINGCGGPATGFFGNTFAGAK